MAQETLVESYEEQEWIPPRLLSLTSFFVLICVLVLLASEWTKSQNGLFSPVQYALFFDYSESFSILELAANSSSAKSQETLLAIYEQMPHWDGLLKWAPNQHLSSIPFVEKLKEGQLWRLVTPIFLHRDWPHLILNISWLFFLGSMMEERMGRSRWLLFVFITAIVCNCAQYIVTGPMFCGFSGVLRGMISYIWARKTFFPLEGYPVSRLTINLSLGYVGLMFGLELLGLYTNFYPFGVDLANTSHLAGVFTGLLLGFMPYFQSIQHYERSLA